MDADTASGKVDPRPQGRVRDPQLLTRLHLCWRECALCGGTFPLSLHHISKHPRDDVEGNLVMLCGDGVRGCHGKVEAHDEETIRELGMYVTQKRADTIDYLYGKFVPDAADEWIRRHFLLDLRDWG